MCVVGEADRNAAASRCSSRRARSTYGRLIGGVLRGWAVKVDDCLELLGGSLRGKLQLTNCLDVELLEGGVGRLSQTCLGFQSALQPVQLEVFPERSDFRGPWVIRKLLQKTLDVAFRGQPVAWRFHREMCDWMDSYSWLAVGGSGPLANPQEDNGCHRNGQDQTQQCHPPRVRCGGFVFFFDAGEVRCLGIRSPNGPSADTDTWALSRSVGGRSFR